jgi:hypothetical protein
VKRGRPGEAGEHTPQELADELEVLWLRVELGIVSWPTIHHKGQGPRHRCCCSKTSTTRGPLTVIDGTGPAETLLGLDGFKVVPSPRASRSL